METKQNLSQWPQGESQMAQMVRSTDWSKTSLGPLESWSSSLKTAITICLDSHFPMYVWWGEDSINIYNDAYIALAGKQKHPQFFGKPAKEMWSEIWPLLEGFKTEVFSTGKAILHEDLQMPLEREGVTEEAYFTFSYGPLRDGDGAIQGIHCTCFETTGKVFAQRKNESANQDLQSFFMQSPVPMVILMGTEYRFSLVNPPYEKLIGKKNLVGKTIFEAFNQDELKDFVVMLDNVYKTGITHTGREMYLPLTGENGKVADNWIDVGYHPYRDERGKIQGILAIITNVTEQVLSKKEIEKSHKEFQELANYMPQIVWTATPTGELDYFNDVWFNYSQSSYEENAGTGWVKFVHPDDLENTARNWSRSLKEKSSYTNEFRLKRGDGTYRWHIARAYPIKDSHDNMTKWVGTNTDIHEAKTFTNDLSFEKLKFETLFADASTSMALLRGENLTIEMVNPSYDQLFQNRIRIGQPFLENLPELIGQPFPDLLKNVFRTGIAYREDEAQAFLRRTNESPLEERFFRQTYTQVLDTNGEPYGVFIHAIEVTDVVRARTQLEHSRNRLNLAIQAAHMGTWHIDLKTMEVNTSDEFQKIFEFGFVGGNIFDEISRLMHPEDVAEVNRIWQESVNKKTPYIHEYRIVTKTGKIKWVHSRGQATYEKDGTPLTLSGVIMDITDKKLAEHKLASLARDLSLAVSTRDEFMSIASHELKTPLTSMRLQTQSMQRNIKRGLTDALSVDRVVRLIENTDKQVTRLIRLVDDMLDVSRIESGKLSINFEQLDLKDLVSEVYIQLKEQLENAGCSTHLALGEGARGSFDRYRIEQVVTNLITNAMRYGAGKPIYINLNVRNGTASLTIKDQGIGIAPENSEKIFKRFERIVTPSEISGLGLGLYITKEIILAHRGKIWVESTIGLGSTFIVELPL